MDKWIIIHFCKDNSVEAVLNIWFKNYICAWQILLKYTSKFIETMIKPSKKKFIFLPPRILRKAYGW
jgi:hypothetical protein